MPTRFFHFPKTLYRYLIMEVLAPFLGGVFFFLFVLLMFQVIRLSDFFVVHKVSLFMVLRLMSFLTLSFLPVVIPIAFLLAVLVGFGRLSTDNEVMAMRASGVSIFRMLHPVLLLGLGMSFLSLVLNLYLVPWGSRMFRYEIFRISNTKAITTIHEGTFTENFFDFVIYADETDPKDNTLRRVFIYDEKDNERAFNIIAESGKIISQREDRQGMPGIILRLFNGTMHRANTEKNLFEFIEFKTYDIFLKMQEGKIGGVDKPKTMDFDYLTGRLRELYKDPIEKRADWEILEERQLLQEYWKRYALSVSCIIFAIMGVAFGVLRTRTVRSNSILICFLVLLVYWSIYSIGSRWSEDGVVSPFLGMWAANMLLLTVSIFTFYRTAK